MSMRIVKFKNLNQENLKDISITMKKFASSTKRGDPGNPFFTQKEATLFLAEAIQILLNQGWTYSQVSDLLGKLGFKIPVGTLSVYVKRNVKPVVSKCMKQPIKDRRTAFAVLSD